MKILVKPSADQIAGASFLIKRNRGFLLYATGTGKTLIQIMVAFKAIADKRVDRFLIVCTKSSMIEVEKDFRDLTDVSPCIIQDTEGLRNWVEDSSIPIALTQYGWVERLTSDGQVEEVKSKDGQTIKGKVKPSAEKTTRTANLFKRWKMGISFDEFHKLKNPESYITRAFAYFRPLFTLRYGVTATGVMKNLMDVYHLSSFLEPGFLGTEMDFKYRYIEVEMKRITRYKKIPVIKGYRNLDGLDKRLDDIRFTYFPEYDIEFVKTEGVMENWNEYMSAAKGVFDKDGEDLDVEKRHSSRLVDLQFVVNRDPGKAKILLNSLQKTIQNGVIIYCSFYESLNVVKETLDKYKIQHKEITGQMADSKDREDAKDWFNADPRNKVLLITLAGGQSLNLQSTNNLVFFDIPFGIGYLVQVFGRVCRQFSEHKKFVIEFLCMKDTVDDYKYELAAANKELFVKIMRNKVIPPSEMMENFNGVILQRLKKSLLWKK